MSESTNAKLKPSYESVNANTLKRLSTEALNLTGYPADRIGVVRNLALKNQVPLSFVVIAENDTLTFTNDNSRCFPPEYLKIAGHICPDEYIPKVERAWTKNKSVLLVFTHMGYETAADDLTAEEIEFLVKMANKNKHDVYALLITADEEIGIKYSIDTHEIFCLPTTVI